MKGRFKSLGHTIQPIPAKASAYGKSPGNNHLSIKRSRPRPPCRRAVITVAQRAIRQRQAAATYTLVQLIAQHHQLINPSIELVYASAGKANWRMITFFQFIRFLEFSEALPCKAIESALI